MSGWREDKGRAKCHLLRFCRFNAICVMEFHAKIWNWMILDTLLFFSDK